MSQNQYRSRPIRLPVTLSPGMFVPNNNKHFPTALAHLSPPAATTLGGVCFVARHGSTDRQADVEAAPTEPARGMSPFREALRSRVRSGLLLHLCPSPGPFADIFGCGDEVRLRILGVLSARDLATFALVSAGRGPGGGLEGGNVLGSRNVLRGAGAGRGGRSKEGGASIR